MRHAVRRAVRVGLVRGRGRGTHGWRVIRRGGFGGGALRDGGVRFARFRRQRTDAYGDSDAREAWYGGDASRIRGARARGDGRGARGRARGSNRGRVRWRFIFRRGTGAQGGSRHADGREPQGRAGRGGAFLAVVRGARGRGRRHDPRRRGRGSPERFVHAQRARAHGRRRGPPRVDRHFDAGSSGGRREHLPNLPRLRRRRRRHVRRRVGRTRRGDAQGGGVRGGGGAVHGGSRGLPRPIGRRRRFD